MSVFKKSTILGNLNINRADRFSSRLKGLLFTPSLDEFDALLIVPCGSIHTLGMHYAIHVLFLDANNTILAINNHVAPNRFCLGPRGSKKVIELSATHADIPSTIIGQLFCEGEL